MEKYNHISIVKAIVYICLAIICFFVIRGCVKDSEKYSDEYYSVIQSMADECINDSPYFRLEKILYNHPYIEMEIYPTGKINALDHKFAYEDQAKEITEKFYNYLKGDKLKDGNTYNYNIDNIYLNFYGYDSELKKNTLESGRFILLDLTRINGTRNFEEFWNSK